ncbi:molybdenum cofactor guanylyltransferase [Desulforhopalus singaporensis]|uniref:Molybdopterin-guanine dinucleotide biosynthesis protein A n=1 Tax=Desulforhopalus singaporensis TaxID=91360 RepID=A0A1H0TFK9_9BACT|nr:molybdenum cofactor guanylyltransferase [Desulforhopalus singaporensis]SDP52842.1 Molybdopterin-guanine dinucleotide biosynthesis protein A [Desulforhopalus singaporensis]
MRTRDSGENYPPTLSQLPVFKICGQDKRQREEFLQKALTVLDRRGLYGAVAGKDHLSGYALSCLARRFDVVFTLQGPDVQVQTIFLGSGPQAKGQTLCITGDGDRALEKFGDELAASLSRLMQAAPLWGCVLIGGRSSRMGRPKHLIRRAETGPTWIERAVALLRPEVDGIVVSGAGELPEELENCIRLPDIPGVAGPLTGIVAATRWHPMASWIFLACDMPLASTPALRWLLENRRAGSWGRVPKLAGANRCEPLFALYERCAGQLFEDRLLLGERSINQIGTHPKIDNPVIPDRFRGCWKNINTPDQLRQAENHRSESS